MSTQFKYTIKCKNSQFQTIQFSVITQFSSIWLIDRTLSGTTTSGHSGPGIDGNKEVLRIFQSSSITGTSPSDCLVSYPGHLLRGGLSYPSAVNVWVLIVFNLVKINLIFLFFFFFFFF